MTGLDVQQNKRVGLSHPCRCKMYTYIVNI